MNQFPRLANLPPYVFSVVAELKSQLIAKGVDVIDLGMGNPDEPTPTPIVETLLEAAKHSENHRYSDPKGILPLREAISHWYQRKYQVSLDPITEATVTIGSKEGLAHLAFAILGDGEGAIVPDPCYPVHGMAPYLAGARLFPYAVGSEEHMLKQIKDIFKGATPKPKLIVLNFPANPSTVCVTKEFFAEIIKIAQKENCWVIQDLAYADIAFDGYQPPSILQIPGAKDVAVESFTLSKSYNMAGWRMGFVCGNPQLIAILRKIKSYMDYGSFAPLEYGAITALEKGDEWVKEISNNYEHRRNVLCEGLNAMGWKVEKPKATMFVWAKIPTEFKNMTSLEFTQYLLKETGVALSPGSGFGAGGEGYVRIALIEKEDRLKEALRRIEKILKSKTIHETQSLINREQQL